MLHERLKKMMDDIIDVAFADSDVPESLKRRFKWYKLYILPKESDTTGGKYNVNDHVIEVYNARLGGEFMAKCCLHELSHHIDWCINGVTGHKDPFFAVFAKLIYAALDMGILTQETFDDGWSKDHDRVMEILAQYCPHEVDYKRQDAAIVRVHNSYSIKNQLKERGYKWNNIEAVWEIETEDEEGEESFLESIGAVLGTPGSTIIRSPWYTIEENNMVLDPTVYIEAKDWGRRTYDAREALKKEGFFFSGNQKKWLYKVKSEEFEEKLQEFQRNPDLSGLEFKCQNRKVKKTAASKK